MTLKVAVIGAGYWGRNLVRNFHELGGLAAVCDMNETVLAGLRTKHQNVAFSSDISKVLEDPTINAVAIATPAVSHFSLASRALEAGKDVFVEKPLAISVEDGEKLASMAESRGRILMVGHILRYHPAIIKLRELIRDGRLGRIQYLYSNRLNIGKIRTEENILWSFAPHDISVMLALLDEMPDSASCQGGAYLNPSIFDVTLSQFHFASGVRAHIFVSWLHPLKEQRLVVVGSEMMALFDDTACQKLVLFRHRVEWKNRFPMAVKVDGEPVTIDQTEPLRAECAHFLDCGAKRIQPITDGIEGLRVLRVLDACQRSLSKKGETLNLSADFKASQRYFIHSSAFVDEGALIGAGTKIWHFSHIMKGAIIGEKCVIGQNVNIDGGTILGNNVKIQNNVSVYTGTVIEDDGSLDRLAS